MISGFRRGVDQNCALLGVYTKQIDRLLQTFRGNLSVPYLPYSRVFLDCLTIEDGTDRLFRNVGNIHQSTLCTIAKQSRALDGVYCAVRIESIHKYFFLWRCDPTRGHGLLILEVF